jgi:hypothetical protein
VIDTGHPRLRATHYVTSMISLPVPVLCLFLRAKAMPASVIAEKYLKSNRWLEEKKDNVRREGCTELDNVDAKAAGEWHLRLSFQHVRDLFTGAHYGES